MSCCCRSSTCQHCCKAGHQGEPAVFTAPERTGVGVWQRRVELMGPWHMPCPVMLTGVEGPSRAPAAPQLCPCAAARAGLASAAPSLPCVHGADAGGYGGLWRCVARQPVIAVFCIAKRLLAPQFIIKANLIFQCKGASCIYKGNTVDIARKN